MAIEKPDEFVNLLPPFPERAIMKGVGHALLHVLAQDDLLQTLQRSAYRMDLRQDVHAVALLFEHVMHSPHLSFDAGETALAAFLCFRVHP